MFQNIITAVSTSTAVATCSNFIGEKIMGKSYILHCKIRFRAILLLCTTSGCARLLWSFYEHTATVLISQLISCLTCTRYLSIPKRGFFYDLSPADNKWTAARSATCQLISDTCLVVVHNIHTRYVLLLYIYHDITPKEREDNCCIARSIVYSKRGDCLAVY